MIKLVTGQKCNITDITKENILNIKADINMTGCDIDVSCFGVDSQGKLSNDSYFIFYNQLSSPEGAIKKSPSKDEFTINLSAIPEFINKLVITAAIDGNKDLSNLEESKITFQNGLACYEFSGKQFEKEKAIIIAEIYRYNGLWKVSVVGKGFNGGLSALLAFFGGEEIKEEQSQKQPQNNQTVSLKKSDEVKRVVLQKAPHLIDLTKKAIDSFEKRNLTDIKAQVVLVLDVSGSMYDQYKEGRVQRILDKVLPLALLFDDNGNLESWGFARTFKRLQNATLDNITNYIENTDGGWKKWNVGGTNNEPAIMEELYSMHKNSKVPVYIIFISDGGVSKNKKIKEIITKASHAPMFWQFVGIHGTNYGALEMLDTMTGRLVDNANFFALDDIDSISDEALYDRLMNEFPLWLQAAKAKNII